MATKISAAVSTILSAIFIFLIISIQRTLRRPLYLKNGWNCISICRRYESIPISASVAAQASTTTCGSPSSSKICSRSITRSGNTLLPSVALAGIASFVLFCRTISSFFKSRSRYNTNLADVKEMEDRISQLSNDIIYLIITKLQARDAVRTSVLSRRWRNLYTCITEVRFNCLNMFRGYCDEGGKNSPLQWKFLEGVDTFLQLHSGCKITSFFLCCCFSQRILHKFRKWMHSLGRLGVEQLLLQFCCSSADFYKPTFSFHLLSEASSLKHLSLYHCSLQPTLKSQCDFLKVLELNNVSLGAVEVDYILSTCSSLESLKFFYCKLPFKLRIHGPDLKLKILIVLSCKKVNEINLHAANLVTFECCNFEMLTLCLSYVPLLQNLCIEFFGNHVVPYVFGEVTKHLPQLRSLIFLTSGNFYQRRTLAKVINKLSNLRQLVLALVQENECDLLRITLILDSCPLLQKFHLSTIESKFDGQHVKKTATFHLSLKEVGLGGFCGTKNQMDFASYILKSAVALDRMCISTRVRYYLRDGRWWLKNVASWSEEKRRMIQERLQDQAISKTAKIITL